MAPRLKSPEGSSAGERSRELGCRPKRFTCGGTASQMPVRNSPKFQRLLGLVLSFFLLPQSEESQGREQLAVIVTSATRHTLPIDDGKLRVVWVPELGCYQLIHILGCFFCLCRASGTSHCVKALRRPFKAKAQSAAVDRPIMKRIGEKKEEKKTITNVRVMSNEVQFHFRLQKRSVLVVARQTRNKC